jgi:hypothetical protein
MSFRRFIYYSAIAGGWAALAGWALGRPRLSGNPIVDTGVKGAALGIFVALALGLVDGLWMSARRWVPLTVRTLVAAAGGTVSGFVGGVAGQALYGWFHMPAMWVFGWALTGLLIGASLGFYEIMRSSTWRENASGARRKIINGILGGAVGGAVGGTASLALKSAWAGVFQGRLAEQVLSPSATGFVVLGLSIGLAVGLAQVILKDAWVRVEVGFRAGREMLLSKDETTIGRGENCDIGLFDDPFVSKRHAKILRKEASYILIPEASCKSPPRLNDSPIAGPTLLRSGDLIKLGHSQLRFQERQRRASQPSGSI